MKTRVAASFAETISLSLLVPACLGRKPHIIKQLNTRVIKELPNVNSLINKLKEDDPRTGITGIFWSTHNFAYIHTPKYHIWDSNLWYYQPNELLLLKCASAIKGILFCTRNRSLVLRLRCLTFTDIYILIWVYV